MSADNRSTHTDALATLGTIIDINKEKRDAIHLGVEPIVAGMILQRGAHIGIGPNGKAYDANYMPELKAVGIVDPFLRDKVKKGEAFWLIVYPRQITSLRHVWEHPDFKDSKETTYVVVSPEQAFKAKLMIGDPECVKANQDMEDEASRLNTSVEELLAHANQWEQGSSEYWTQGGDFEGEYLTQQFWDAWAVMYGREPKERTSHFSCSC
jgi:hypothetical protein